MVGVRWARIPQEAKDLIQRMLVVDPFERITMPEVTSNCWLRGTAGYLSGDYSEMCSEMCT